MDRYHTGFLWKSGKMPKSDVSSLSHYLKLLPKKLKCSLGKMLEDAVTYQFDGFLFLSHTPYSIFKGPYHFPLQSVGLYEQHLEIMKIQYVGMVPIKAYHL